MIILLFDKPVWRGPMINSWNFLLVERDKEKIVIGWNQINQAQMQLQFQIMTYTGFLFFPLVQKFLMEQTYEEKWGHQ